MYEALQKSGEAGQPVPAQGGPKVIARPFATEVASLRDLTYDIKEVRLRLIEPARMDFIAGQFIRFEAPAYEKSPAPVSRCYSLAAPPSVADEIQLHVRYVPNGICTTYVHQYLKVGDKVTVRGPYGRFRLHEGEGDVICIAGGSGMAPIRSLLLDMRDKGIRRRVRYFFGAKARRDLYMTDEMSWLESVLPDFRFIPALSEPQPGDDWRGETGLITEVVDRLSSAHPASQAYLCGSPLMIDACVKVLRGKGMGDERIFFDKFV
jgi:Na+-transporting NADH:ubiquinone oxidoreductase subunit F